MPSQPPKSRLVSVTLQRDGVSVPWGFRLCGGCDLQQPLVVTRVTVGSPSDEVLRSGDVIRKIGDYDARDLSHDDALRLFKNCGATINVVVERPVSAVDGSKGERSLRSGPTPPALSPPIAGARATPFTIAASMAPRSNVAATTVSEKQPIRNNLCRFPPALVEAPSPSSFSTTTSSSNCCCSWEDNASANWHTDTEKPYRTTPLVLPGAKVNKDPAPTMSYLRHHPNPMMRSRPTEYEWVPADIARKQQLADTMLEKAIGNDLKTGKKVVAKQFNSPIGMYSDQNIANSVSAQAGRGSFTPSRKTVHYDPSKSETYKALHESELDNGVHHEVNIPVTRVFSPVKTPTKFEKLTPPSSAYNPNQRASPQPHPTAPHPKNFDTNTAGGTSSSSSSVYEFNERRIYTTRNA